MPDQKPSTFTPATLPLAGTELVPLIQGGANRVVAASALGAASTINAPDLTLAVTGSGTGVVSLSASPLNVLPGTFSYAGLPSASVNANKFAVTTDKGAVFSNGVFWQILYNPTQGSLAVGTGSPLPQAGNAVPYSVTFVATGNNGAPTWSLQSTFGATNTWTMSSAGVLTGTPTVNTTDSLLVQVTDPTGAVAQRLVTLQTVATLSPAATPTFSPAAGAYLTTQTVTISDSTGSSTIYYTTNGSTPTTASTVYTAPLTVSVTTTIKAIATAPGFSQSAVGTGAYTIGLLNPMGINLSAGGGASFEYEGFPLFVDRVRESRGFVTSIATYAQSNLNTSGWPDGTQASVTCVLFTGAVTGLGLNPWFYNAGTSSYRTFKGGFTGSGAETVTGSGCTIANLARSGANSTFDLTFTGSGAVYIVIGNISVAMSNIHCYLPDYPTGVGVGPNNEFTSDAVNFYSQFGYIRFMWAQNAWNNTAHTTAANRNTATNTRANKSWSAPTGLGGTNSEGYPVEWMVDLCVACNCGGWFNIAGDFANDYVTAVANYLFSNMPVGKPIFIEYGNEVWNGTGGVRAIIQSFANTAGYTASSFTGTIVGSALTVNSAVTGTININDHLFYSGVPSNLSISGGSGTSWTLSASPGNIGPVAMTTNTVNQLYSYLAVPLHTIAGIFSGIFGARYGTDLRMVLGTQQGQISLASKTITNSIALGYMPSTGWASPAASDYHHIAVAPYMNMKSPSAGWTVAQIEANLAGTDASGNNNAANVVCNASDKIEGLSVEAKYYGLISAIAYEEGWQTNSESSSITNIGNAIVDSGMTAVEQTLAQNVYNSGATHCTHYESGCVALSALSGSSILFDQLDYSTANLIAGNSPRFKALSPFFNGATPAKNVVGGSGASFSALNYADNLGTTYPVLGAGFFGVAPPYTVHGLVPYNVNCTVAGTYSLRIRWTNASGTAGVSDVSIDGANVITGVSIPGSITNSLVTMGTVTLTKGPHALLLGRSGTINANLTIGALANSGADITWV